MVNVYIIQVSIPYMIYMDVCILLFSANQLRLVVYLIIFKFLATSQVVVWDFFHQQYHLQTSK